MQGEQFLDKVRIFADRLQKPDIPHPDFLDGVPIVGAGRAETADEHLAAVIAQTSQGTKAFVFRADTAPDSNEIDVVAITNGERTHVRPFEMRTRYDGRPDFVVSMVDANEAPVQDGFTAIGALIVPGCMNTRARVFGPLTVERRK